MRWTRAELLRQLASRRDAGLPLDATSVQDEMPTLYTAAMRHFGSYMAVARRFGAVPRQRAWNRDAVLGELRRLARGKRVLSTRDVPGGLLHACARYFGTFEQARIAAGVKGIERQHWSRERVVEVLRDRARRGLPITGKALGSSLFSACWHYFGGIDAALAAAKLQRA